MPIHLSGSSLEVSGDSVSYLLPMKSFLDFSWLSDLEVYNFINKGSSSVLISLRPQTQYWQGHHSPKFEPFPKALLSDYCASKQSRTETKPNQKPSSTKYYLVSRISMFHYWHNVNSNLKSTVNTALKKFLPDWRQLNKKELRKRWSEEPQVVKMERYKTDTKENEKICNAQYCTRLCLQLFYRPLFCVKSEPRQFEIAR